MTSTRSRNSPAAGVRRRQFSALAAGAAAGLWTPAQSQSQPPTLAAASDLKFAIEELAAIFEAQTGQRLRLVFGSSGQFAAQLLQGAPFQMFMSADEDYVFRLADAGLTEPRQARGRLYALGRIGVLVPQGSPLQADGSLRDLAAALRDGRLRRFAIANPEHAPYGARAREALQHAGLWQAIQPHLVLGENISQAAQFATTGAAQGGIVALSLALAPAVARLGRFDLIPAAWHRPLRQRLVLMKDAPAALHRFQAFLFTPAAQAVMKRYGFEPPVE